MPLEARDAYLASAMQITDFGQDVLQGLADRAQHCRMDFWLGGTHATNDSLWRWDRENEALAAPG